MPTTITPANGFDTASALTRPAPGERVGMETGASPLAPLLQRLADRDETLRLGLLGHMVGGDRMSVDPGGTSTAFTVRVSPIRAALIKDATDGVWRGVSLGAQTLGLSATAGPLAALAPDTWYYVTLAVEAGVPRLYINVFGPDDSLVWETGSPDTFRYIGCFRTDGSGAPLPMRMHRGRYVYRRSATASSPFQVLSSTTPVGYTDISLAALVPPHVRVAILDLNVDAGGGVAYLDLRTKGDTSDVSIHVVAGTAAAGGSSHGSVEMETDSARAIQYELALGTAATLQGQVWVTGFAE